MTPEGEIVEVLERIDAKLGKMVEHSADLEKHRRAWAALTELAKRINEKRLIAFKGMDVEIPGHVRGEPVLGQWYSRSGLFTVEDIMEFLEE